MNIDDLKAAIERRGYIMRKYPDRIHLTTFAIYRNGGPITPETPGIVQSLTDKHLEEVDIEFMLYPFTQGQRHMCCIQCKEPLLQKEVKMIGIPELVFEPDYKPEPTRYKYRSAKAGPDSEVLIVCPGCGLELDAQSAVEITD